MNHLDKITIHDTTSGKSLTLDCISLLRRIPCRRTVYEGNLDGKAVIIKCFSPGLHTKRRYNREIHGFKELTLRSIKTSEIVAAGPTDNNEYVVVLSKIKHAGDVFTLLTSDKTRTDNQSILTCVFKCIAIMHETGVLQPDLHLGNFLWDGENIFVLDPAEMVFFQGPLNKELSFQQLAVLLGSLPETSWTDKNSLIKQYFYARHWRFGPGHHW